MSIDLLPEQFSRVTQTQMVMPVAARPDLLDPMTGRVVVPAFVHLYLRRHEGTPNGDREYAYVTVSGPRRLKSGAAGRQITTAGWERARNQGRYGRVERPHWLSLTVFGLLPKGWSMSLVELTDGVVE